MLPTLVALLAAAAIAVPLTRRAGFGSVLGYLLAGIVIGPAGFRLVTDVQQIASISQLGIVMLLFLIGLELRPRRLWVMRHAVFGLGTAQLVCCTAALAVLARLAGVPWSGAAVIGLGLALSSTAIVLPLLAERGLLDSRAGRDGFAVLLFQDLAFIPLVALVPLLGSRAEMPDHVPWEEVLKAVLGVAAILIGGRFLMRPLFRVIGGARTPEVFTAVALLIVVGTAFLAEEVGLSESLGAFVAGVLLSDSDYRHELRADIEPFEGLLLGFFFISVGMSADVGLAMAHPWLLIGGTAALLFSKSVIMFVIARISRLDTANAVRFALALPQASEFSFVLYAAAMTAGVLAKEQAALATLLAAASMIATPLLFAASERALVPRLKQREVPAYDAIVSDGSPVLICGFGRFGQIIGRVLRMRGIRFTALEQDAGQVDVVRRFGNKVWFGDPTRSAVLRAAGAEEAKLLIVALDDPDAVLRVVETAHRNFPNLKVLARARNRRHAHLLMDRNVDGPVRDTFYSSLHMAEMSLTELGIPPGEAQHTVALFREHDEQHLRASHAIYRDEKQLVQSVQQATEELDSLFEADRAR
jgi:monovalent cation:proton antiporter-2 (CPA2) family protein